MAKPERLYLRLDGDPPHAPESEAPVGSICDAPLVKSLSQHIAHVAVCREVLPPGEEVLERILPDGAVRWIVEWGAGAPTQRIAGANAEPVVLRLSGSLRGITFTFRMGAAAALLGVPASELTGCTVNVDDLWGAAGRELGQRLASEPDDSSRIALVTKVLCDRLRAAEDLASPQRAMRAVALVAGAGGRRPLRELAERIGVGERRLQQIFEAHVGLSPRVVGRLARVRGCIRALRSTEHPDWSRLALDAGFYDQAHLTNEFQALVGLSPTAFHRQTISGSSKTVAGGAPMMSR